MVNRINKSEGTNESGSKSINQHGTILSKEKEHIAFQKTLQTRLLYAPLVPYPTINLTIACSMELTSLYSVSLVHYPAGAVAAKALE